MYVEAVPDHGHDAPDQQLDPRRDRRPDPLPHGADRTGRAPGATPVAAVVSAFRPGPSLVRVCESVAGQVDLLVVVDDGPGHAAQTEETLAACRALGAQVVRHETNRGIGAALNSGLAAARAAGDLTGGFVLTLDQDSAVPPGYVDALVAAARSATDHGLRVAMVGPEVVESIGSMVAARPEHEPWRGREPIQSGLLVPVAALEQLGDFDADLFIDGVDSDFYLRAVTRGWDVVVAPGTRLAHRLGTEHAVAGTRARLVHAAPFRYYYIARNRVVLLRRYGRTAPGWCARAVLKDVRHLAVTTLAVPGRRARLAATLEGWRDGLRGTTGPRPIRPDRPEKAL